MPTRLVPTSLPSFCSILVMSILFCIHLIMGQLIWCWYLCFIGSIIQVGQKLGEQIDSSGLKALLAILLLIVGINS